MFLSLHYFFSKHSVCPHPPLVAYATHRALKHETNLAAQLGERRTKWELKTGETKAQKSLVQVYTGHFHVSRLAQIMRGRLKFPDCPCLLYVDFPEQQFPSTHIRVPSSWNEIWKIHSGAHNYKHYCLFSILAQTSSQTEGKATQTCIV